MLWSLKTLERCTTILTTVAIVGLFAAALGPPTDADSLDYHIGVPLDWLRSGGASARPDWFHARLVGLGESLNMLGLAAGTDNFGALMQFSGLISAMIALCAFAPAPRDRVLAWLLVAACPVMLFLIPNQKPQMLPTAATTVALVLAVSRFSCFRFVEALLAFGCTAFAAASKTSFLLSAGIVVLVCLAAAHKSGYFARAVAIGAAAFTLLLVPLLVRNYVFYGDPASPFLERFRDSPDLAITAFAEYLRAAAIQPSIGNFVRLPIDMTITPYPGNVSTILGLGTLAFLPAMWTRGTPRLLLWAALGTTLATLTLGQLAGRFFLEPYLWVGAALLTVSWGRLKEVLFRALALQSAVVAVISLYGGATLFPGALTASLRDSVMMAASAGYAEGKWLNEILPRDSILLQHIRFHALSPRPFAATDPAFYNAAVRADDERLASFVAASGADTLVVPTQDDLFRNLIQKCGKPLGEPARFLLATRNPFNRVEYELRAFTISGCQSIRQRGKPDAGMKSPLK